MPNTLNHAGFSSQTLQGVGARLLRRFGGALRSTFAGMARVGRPRHDAAPQSNPSPQTAQDQPASTPPPSQPPPRRPRRGNAAPRRPAPTGRAPIADAEDAPFSPETYPGLSPEACAFFNTPAEDCDPEMLRALLVMVAHHIADNLPPEAGMTGAGAVFAELCDRLALPLDEAEPAGQPDEAAATATAEAPDALPAEPQAPGEPPAAGPPDAAPTAGIATGPVTPDTTLPPRRSARHGRPPRHARAPRSRHGRHAGCRCRHRPIGRVARSPRQALPPRRLCYAACAGPS